MLDPYPYLDPIQWIQIHNTARFYSLHIQYTWTYALVVYRTGDGNIYDSHAFSGLNIDKNGWLLCGASVQIVLCPAHASTQLITPPSLNLWVGGGGRELVHI